MKKLLVILIPLAIILIIASFVWFDYFKATKLSISIAPQTVSEEIVINSINLPGNGFAYIFQQTKSNNKFGLFLGGTDFLTKGTHRNVKIKTIKAQIQKIDPEISKYTVKLIEDTTGERLIDTSDDKPFKSLFGFEFKKEFLSL
ncbi:hypothetical protein KBB41_00925 [Candidatus Curtissbacteria bacterium]|nr:hypothetical protein [Candidatus Curtissbacteria bacterium]